MNKSHFFLLMLSVFSMNAFGQVGINTENPQQIFHIDGASSSATQNPKTGTPTIVQQTDDFVVTPEGSVGVGTIEPKGKLDIVSHTSGFVMPRLSFIERDDLIIGRRPTGAVIYNIDINRMQVNIGTDLLPIWSTVDVASNTYNTSIVFSNTAGAFGTQVIGYNASNNFAAVQFTNIAFNNTPAGYVAKQANNSTIRLKEGKTYKMEINMGRTASRQTSSTSSSNNYNPTHCELYNITDATVLSTVTILPNGNSSNNNPSNTMLGYVTTGINTKDINVRCYKEINGFIWINYVVPAIWSITITN